METLCIVKFVLLITAIIMAAIAVSKGKEGYANVPCYESITKSYTPYKCFQQPDFQASCVAQVDDNQTISQLLAEDACKASEPILWDTPYAVYPY